LDQTLPDGDDAPEEHDGGKPGGRRDSFENDVAWNLLPPVSISDGSVGERAAGAINHLEQNVRNEECEKCHIVIISRHV
jgi:hypothetical protein